MNEFLSILFDIDSLMGLVHVILALFCLLLGPVIFLRRKGDRNHRLLGRIWAVAMLVMNCSALLTYGINGSPNLFHFFALLNLSALLPGWYCIRKFRSTRKRKYRIMHMEFMAWAYFGLTAAGVWQIVTSFVRMDALDRSPGIVFNVLGALTFIFAAALFVFLKYLQAGKDMPPTRTP